MNASFPFPVLDITRGTPTPRTRFAGQTKSQSTTMVTGSPFPERTTMGRARAAGAASPSTTSLMHFPTMLRSGRTEMETDTATTRRDIAVTSSRTTRPNGPMRTVTGTEAIQTPVRTSTVPLDMRSVAQTSTETGSPMSTRFVPVSTEPHSAGLSGVALTRTEIHTPIISQTFARVFTERRTKPGCWVVQTPTWTVGLTLVLQAYHRSTRTSIAAQTDTEQRSGANTSGVGTPTWTVGLMWRTTFRTTENTGSTAMETV